jgi:hypothetical protein
MVVKRHDISVWNGLSGSELGPVVLREYGNKFSGS